MNDDKLRPLRVNVTAEVERHFDNASLPADSQPHIVLIMGGPASGKTRLRRDKFVSGHVLVDAAEIFIRLSQGTYYDFPSILEEPMETIGRRVASRAIRESRNIVTEIVGSDHASTTELIDAMVSAGYRVEVMAVTCDLETAMQWNMSRSHDNISSYYAEPYQRRWLIEAARDKPTSNPETGGSPIAGDRAR